MIQPGINRHQFLLDDWSILLNGESLFVLNPLATLITSFHLQKWEQNHIVDEVAKSLSASHEEATRIVAQTLSVAESETKPILQEDIDPRTPRELPGRSLNIKARLDTELSGIQFTIRSESNEIIDLVRSLVRPTLPGQPARTDVILDVFKTHEDSQPLYLVAKDRKSLDCCNNTENAALAIYSAIWGVAASQQDWHLLAHGGAVARGNVGILFPAASGSGKSTLIAYLIANGFKFLGDDCIPLLAEDCKLQPVPASLSIKAGSWNVLDALYPGIPALPVFTRHDRKMRFLVPEERRIQQKSVDCSIAITPVYDPDSNEATLEPIERAHMLETLIGTGGRLCTPVKARTVEALVDCMRKVDCYQIRYPTLESAHQQIEQLVS